MIFFQSSSFSETKKIGEILGREVLKMPKMEKALVLGLRGDLGSGKTTFLQGFAKGLGIRDKIVSPTFIIFRKLGIKNLADKKFKNFYHIDCYRLQSAKEIINLGFKKIISNPENIVVVEWADKISRILPRQTLMLFFKIISPEKRIIELCYNKKIK